MKFSHYLFKYFVDDGRDLVFQCLMRPARIVEPYGLVHRLDRLLFRPEATAEGILLLQDPVDPLGLGVLVSDSSTSFLSNLTLSSNHLSTERLLNCF